MKRFREMPGIKQEALAFELGEDWNQKKISLLKQKEAIDVSLLQQISAILKAPVEAFQNFDEEKAINIISNTVNNNDNASGNSLFSYYPTINPIEKWLDAMEEIKRLNAELLKVKDEQIKMLERLMDK